MSWEVTDELKEQWNENPETAIGGILYKKALRHATLLKRDFQTGVFLWTLRDIPLKTLVACMLFDVLLKFKSNLKYYTTLVLSSYLLFAVFT